MGKPAGPPLLRLVLVPFLLTAGVSAFRLYGEVEGDTSTASGGAGELIGITWLIAVFGAWFGYRLAATGSAPRLRPAALWYAVAFLPVLGVGFWMVMGIDRGSDSEAAYQELRGAVLAIAATAVACAAFSFAIWARLSLALCLYGLLARGVVVAIAWLAKSRGWDTHYTKFGPAGIERDSMADTMLSVFVSQFGMWVPATMLLGGFFGALTAALFRRK